MYYFIIYFFLSFYNNNSTWGDCQLAPWVWGPPHSPFIIHPKILYPPTPPPFSLLLFLVIFSLSSPYSLALPPLKKFRRPSSTTCANVGRWAYSKGEVGGV